MSPMPEGYLLHATLTTGHVARHRRSDTDGRAVALVADMIDGLLQGARMQVPGRPGHFATGVNAGRNLITTLHADRTPILTTGVCVQSRSSPRLWRMLHEGPYSLATDSDHPVSAPWIADRIEPGALDHMEAMRWTGGWARCLGWAWLEYDR